MDGVLVEAGKALSLDAGAHEVAIAYRHPAGDRMTLGLLVGREPDVLVPWIWG